MDNKETNEKNNESNNESNYNNNPINAVQTKLKQTCNITDTLINNFKWEEVESVQGSSLTSSLQQLLNRTKGRGCIFLGMDSPDLPHTTILDCVQTVSEGKANYIVPAEDGGYCMLGVRRGYTGKPFEGVGWSKVRRRGR